MRRHLKHFAVAFVIAIGVALSLSVLTLLWGMAIGGWPALFAFLEAVDGNRVPAVFVLYGVIVAGLNTYRRYRQGA